MGSTSSRYQDLPDHKDIFRSTEHVETRLIDKFYQVNEIFMKRLCDTFNEKASTDPSTGIQYWTQQTLIDYLVSRNPSLEEVITDAGPILFKIATHHGSFPFPPSIGANLACNKFLIFIGMCTNLQNHPFVTRDWVGPNHVRSRTKTLDRKRIFFQSISTGNYLDRDELTHSDEDDEDLLDVLVSSQPSETTADRKFNTKARSDLRYVAALLPSSRSGDLGGMIEKEGLERLVTLLVTVSLRECGVELPNGSSWREFTEESVGVVMRTFMGQEVGTGLGWERFSSVISESLPHFLDEFFGFIEDSFQIPHENESQPWIILGSKVLEPQQLSLIKFTSGFHVTDFKTLLYSGPVDESMIKAYVQELTTPIKLLLIKARDINQHQPIIIAVSIYTVHDIIDEDLRGFKEREGFVNVNLIATSPSSLRLVTGNAKVTSDVVSEPFSLEFDRGKLAFERGFSHGRLESGSEGIDFEVLRLEIWGTGGD